MDMEGALKARAIAAASVAGDRIAWDERPQGQALPAASFQVISDPMPQHLKGFDPLRRTLVQLDCWAETYAKAKQLKVQLIAALVPSQTGNGIRFDRMMIDSAQSGKEQLGETTVFRQRVDLGVWWATA